MKKFKPVSKFATKLNEYLDNNKIKALNNFESYFGSNAVCIMTTSFADYCNVERKRNKKKEILSIVICIFGWLIFFRFVLAAFCKDPKLWVLIGDPFYLTGDRVLFNLVIASIALNATVMRTLFIIGK
jgi:hypothetical protein